KDRLKGLTADQATLKAHDDILIGNRPADEPAAALGPALDRLPLHVNATQRFALGSYHGLRFGLILHPQWRPEVFLEGAVPRTDTLPREHQGPRAVLNALERLAKGHGTEAERTREDLAIAEAQLRDYQARLGQPFSHDNYLNRLAASRDQLKAGLS